MLRLQREGGRLLVWTAITGSTPTGEGTWRGEQLYGIVSIGKEVWELLKVIQRSGMAYILKSATQ
jgi:hypothetical protein